jgi:ribose-phosphate pyrophosphokinase
MNIKKDFTIFSGRSHPSFSTELSQVLGVPLGNILIKDFPDGEIGVHIGENVRGRDVFVVQSMAKNPNFYLMELLIIVDALKRASANNIFAVVPYFCYARQDRKNLGREAITAKLVADLLQTAGVSGVLTMDLHTDQIEGFFNIPVDHLRSCLTLVEVVRQKNIKDLVVVAPDVGGIRLGREFSTELKVDLAVVNKRRLDAGQVEANALIGHVKEKNVLLVDDVSSTGNTLKKAALVCKAQGAKNIYVALAHGLMVDSLDVKKMFDKVFVTNSVSLHGCPHLEVVSVAPLFAKAIRSMLTGASVSSLSKSS